MKISLSLFILFLSPSSQASLSVMQGLTSSSSTQINFIGTKGENYKIRMRDPEGHIFAPESQKTISKNFSIKTVVKLKFAGLKTETLYELSIEDHRGVNLDRRHLKTLDTRKIKEATVGFASCMNDYYKTEQTPMWREFLAHKPDVIFLFGDNVYADTRNGRPISDVNGRVLWERYTETRETLELYKTHFLVPLIATWDDHDYGANDGDETYKYKKQTRETFDAFFSQLPIKEVLEAGPGVASKFLAFGQVFYLMDDRSFRTEKTHWGEAQEEWLLKNLNSTKAPSWIINGDQFFGAYHPFESYEKNHPENFKKILSRIKETPSPVVFISGDRHLAELMKIEKSLLGYETFEFTTSAIHAKVYPSSWDKTPNPRQIAGSAGTFNYGIVKTNVDNQWHITFRAFGPSEKLLFEKNLTIKK